MRSESENSRSKPREKSVGFYESWAQRLTRGEQRDEKEN